MLKKTITYKDLDGNSLTETFWFNLRQVDIAKMELMRKGGGFAESLQKIIADQDGEVIINAFEDIIGKAYGLRRDDNKGLEKSPEITKRFMETDAYSILFMELVTNAPASAEFIKGIVPAEMSENMDMTVLPPEMMKHVQDVPPPEEPVQDVPLPEEPKVVEGTVVTGPKDPKDMTREELLTAMKTRSDGLQQ
jgi:hypothetical protein